MKLFVATAVALSLLPAVAHAADRTYIVMLKDAPVASYRGGTNGLAATSPQKTGARKLNRSSSGTRAYRAYLDSRQDAALARVSGDPDVLYAYRTAFAGFAARLNPAQRAQLRRAPQVARVFVSGTRKPLSAATDDAALDGPSGFGDSAAYLGLTTGLWNQLGNSQNAGDGIVVADLDTGITPQHPSFSGAGFPAPPADFTGTCDTGQDPTPANFCNNKLIAARYYVESFGAQHVSPGSFLSPRDDDGHGSHTASSAVGNFGVDPSIKGSDLGVNQISGIAPRARLAVYKVCWVGGDVDDNCNDPDIIAAVDQAVSDGVDVINMSLGGPSSYPVDPLSFALLGASDANVFVANSAGNDGPGATTIGSPSNVPWVTTVGANQPARDFRAAATIDPPTGPNFVITGASVTPALAGGAKAVADAAASALAGKDGALCQPGTLDPAKVNGKVVLCLRGVNDRIEKSKVVQTAGGVGMILYNANPGQDTDTDTHYVPTVHVSNADGLKVKAAVAAGATTATISKGSAVLGAPKVMAAFSSRGPQEAAPDVAKPDVTAPGVNILGANTPNPAANSGLPSGELFQAISGTSMSSPHVAGAAALLRQQHPDWSPAVIKSALMMSANDSVKKEDGTTPATLFDQGSGEIDPTAAGAVKLVLDETTSGYLGYLAEVDPLDFAGAADPVAPSDLNVASIANATVAGSFSTVRTFTSTDTAARRWTAKVDVPGFDAFAGVGAGGFATFNIDPGKTVAVSLFAQRTSAPIDQWAYGEMTLTSAGQALHIPIALKPTNIAAPSPIQVVAETSDGTADVPVQVGFAGKFSALGWGLAAPDVKAAQQIATAPAGAVGPGAGPGVSVFDYTVPEGAQLFSARTVTATANSDLDLFLYYDANGDGTFADDEQVDASASPLSDEAVDELLPPAGRYRVVVVGFATADPTSTYDLDTWTVADDSPDDLSDPPAIALSGDPFDVGIGDQGLIPLDWAGVDAPGLYLGVATFHASDQPSLADGNLVGARVVELTKLTDTTPPGEPTPEPTPEPPGTGAPKPAIRVSSAKLSRNHRVLTLRVKANRKQTVGLRVLKKRRKVAAAAAKIVKKGRHTVRFVLGKRLKKGTFTVRLRLFAPDGQRGQAAFRIRVRR